MLTVDARPHPASPAGTSSPLRVLVVDDHPAVRVGVQQLLDEQPDLSVVDAVASAEAAYAAAERQPVDVVVADYQLGGRSGLWLSRRIKRLARAPRVLILSAYSDGPLAAACVVAEADGLLGKTAVGDELCDAVRVVAAGGTRLPLVAPALADAMRRRLNPQDQAIFGLLLAGCDRREVAATLRLTEDEVDARMWGMLGELEALPSAPGRRRG